MTVARELANSGFSVNLLEAGGLGPDSLTQSLYSGRNTGRPYFPLDGARLRYFGGSSNHWLENGGLRSRPYDASDFERHDWIPNSGWPFNRQHLEPYYKRAQLLCALGPFEYDIAGWVGGDDDAWLTLRDGEIYTGMFQYAARDLYRQNQRNRDQVNGSSSLNVYLNANVIEIECEELGGAVTGIRACTLTGRTFSARAKAYVIASGGIENARLLLASTSTYPLGIGNQHDLVGRYFMEHLHVISGRLVPFDPSRIPEAAIYARKVRREVDSTGALMFGAELRAREQIGNVCALLTPEDDESSSAGVMAIRQLLAARRHNQLTGSPLNVARNLLSDADHRRALRDLLAPLSQVPGDFREIARTAARRATRRPFRPTLMQMLVQAEQVPNPDSQVHLNSHRDRLGLPRVELDWRLTDLDMKTIRRAQELIDEDFRRRGIGRVEGFYGDEQPLPAIHGSWHHIGTTRMHESERHGVVDSNCRVHGLSNLYMAGSSVFPTGGHTTPTLTIVALALRLAERLQAELGATPSIDGEIETHVNGTSAEGIEVASTVDSAEDAA
jgi:choline dehydrogenase-like flavoprotein